MRILLLVIGCVFIPFFYVVFALVGLYTPLSYFYKSIYDYYKSGEPFGIFD